MQWRDHYPQDSVAGCCFVTGDYDPSGGVIDLDIFVDSMQPWGRLCVSPKAVRDMVTTLGLVWPDHDVEAALADREAEVVRLRAENQRMRAAIAKVIDAAKLAQLNDWVAGRVLS